MASRVFLKRDFLDLTIIDDPSTASHSSFLNRGLDVRSEAVDAGAGASCEYLRRLRACRSPALSRLGFVVNVVRLLLISGSLVVAAEWTWRQVLRAWRCR